MKTSQFFAIIGTIWVASAVNSETITMVSVSCIILGVVFGCLSIFMEINKN